MSFPPNKPLWVPSCGWKGEVLAWYLLPSDNLRERRSTWDSAWQRPGCQAGLGRPGHLFKGIFSSLSGTL